ncbi:MAG: hypothetical protein GY925_16755 [Actinomycetia bacterium]|nr:hypothetical protein [Actinomycetes bacterium]
MSPTSWFPIYLASPAIMAISAGKGAFVDLSVVPAAPPWTPLFAVVLLPLCYLDRQISPGSEPT